MIARFIVRSLSLSRLRQRRPDQDLRKTLRAEVARRVLRPIRLRRSLRSGATRLAKSCGLEFLLARRKRARQRAEWNADYRPLRRRLPGRIPRKYPRRGGLR